jgi:hypothetical protein
MCSRDKPKLVHQVHVAVGDLGRHGHREDPYRHRLARICKKPVTGLEDPSAVSTWNFDELQQPSRVPANGDMSVIAFELFDQAVKIRLDELGVPLNTTADCPRRPLREPVCVAEEIPHQFLEPFRIAAYMVHDLYRLASRMFGEQCLADVHQPI